MTQSKATCSVVVQRVEILDLQGKVIRGFSKVELIDISDLESGMYIIRVETESYIGIKRLVKP